MIKNCAVANCANQTKRGTLCHKHKMRKHRHGSVEKTLIPTKDMSLSERLSFHGWIVEDNGCWVWLGKKDRKGYGGLQVKGKKVSAHRAAYEAWVGPIHEGLLVRHKCDNPPCINPAHLELGTHKENAEDKFSRGRGLVGDSHPNSKLTSEVVRQIRERHDEPVQLLAEQHGVSVQCIRDVLAQRTWRDK